MFEQSELDQRSLRNEIKRLRQVGEHDRINLQQQKEQVLALLYQIPNPETSPNSTLSPAAPNNLLQLMPIARQSRHSRSLMNAPQQQLITAVSTAATNTTTTNSRHTDLDALRGIPEQYKSFSKFRQLFQKNSYATDKLDTHLTESRPSNKVCKVGKKLYVHTKDT